MRCAIESRRSTTGATSGEAEGLTLGSGSREAGGGSSPRGVKAMAVIAATIRSPAPKSPAFRAGSWVRRLDQALADGDRTILVERGVIAERRHEQFQRLAFDQAFVRQIVDGPSWRYLEGLAS